MDEDNLSTNGSYPKKIENIFFPFTILTFKMSKTIISDCYCCHNAGYYEQEPEQFQQMKRVGKSELQWIYICKDCEQSDFQVAKYIVGFICIHGQLMDIPRLLWPRLQLLNGGQIQHHRLLRTVSFPCSYGSEFDVFREGINGFDSLCRFLGVKSADEIKVGNTYSVTHHRVSCWWHDSETHINIEKDIEKDKQNVINFDNNLRFTIWIERYLDDKSLVLWENSHEKWNKMIDMSKYELSPNIRKYYERSTSLKPDTTIIKLIAIKSYPYNP
jgi:hypothetical protein